MATPNVVPRGNGEGTLGTSAKKWLKVYTTTGFQVGADNAAGTLQMTNSNNGEIIWEGSGADAHETSLRAVNATADRTLTLPNLTGTLATTDVAGGGTGGTSLDGAGIVTKTGTQTVSGTKTFSAVVVKMTNLPTSDPGVTGQLWNNSGVLTISA